MPGKRSDPRKLAKEREQIRRDVEERSGTPQHLRQYPSVLEQGRRNLMRLVGPQVEAIQDAIEKRKKRRNPPPRREGAEVIGYKRGPNDA